MRVCDGVNDVQAEPQARTVGVFRRTAELLEWIERGVARARSPNAVFHGTGRRSRSLPIVLGISSTE